MLVHIPLKRFEFVDDFVQVGRFDFTGRLERALHVLYELGDICQHVSHCCWDITLLGEVYWIPTKKGRQAQVMKSHL